MRLTTRDVLAAKQHLAGGGLQLTSELFEEGTFACAVGADDATQLTVAEFEVHIPRGMYATKTHIQIAGFQQRNGTHASSPLAAFLPKSFCKTSPKLGMMPLGTNKTKTTKMAPKTKLELKVCCVPIWVVNH